MSKKTACDRCDALTENTWTNDWSRLTLDGRLRSWALDLCARCVEQMTDFLDSKPTRV